MQSQVMNRAWKLFKNKSMGYASIGAAMRDAWAEFKGEILICEELQAVKIQHEDCVMAMGRVALDQLALYVAG